MAKRILTLCLALAIGIAFAMPAVAEVKSVKVGGEIIIRGIYRDNLDFVKDEYTEYYWGYADGSEGWLMSTVRVWVAAELSDNVSAVVRLINERDWSRAWDIYRGDESVDVDLAYIKIADLFAPGLTATLGRQEILLGKGFVVGHQNFIPWGWTGWIPSAIRAGDLNSQKAFDAWRLDYEVGTVPLTSTLFGAKLDESSAPWGNNQDADLMGLNVAYKLDNATIEGYILNLLWEGSPDDYNIYTYGARVDHNVLTVPGLNYNIEAAMQTGDSWSVDKDAWALNADVSYTLQNPYQAKIGAAWFMATGQDPSSSDDTAWDPIYPDNLGDRIGRITYASMLGWGVIPPGTNISVPKIYGSFKPADKHTVSLALFPASTLAEPFYSGGPDELGWGINCGYTYQYTDDVSFGLLVDYAVADKVLEDFLGPAFDDTAMQAIATVALKF